MEDLRRGRKDVAGVLLPSRASDQSVDSCQSTRQRRVRYVVVASLPALVTNRISE